MLSEEIEARALSIELALKTPLCLSQAALDICAWIAQNGGRCLAVGGCVRDHLLGIVNKDVDLEVYALVIEDLERILEQKFSVHAVGRAFGVLKVTHLGETVDVALPRTENKNGQGHRGFVTSSNPNMSFKDAAQRRDFTFNAMAFDIKNQVILDEFNGLDDLKKSILRHVSGAFAEDPLRVLRACQFAARFQCTIAAETVMMCQSLQTELKTLPSERLWQEWNKLFSASKPSLGLKALLQTSAIELFPELKALQGIEQDQLWHPEGDVWVHTLMVVDQAAQISVEEQLEEEQHLELMFAALCHDFGKVSCTSTNDAGKICSYGHEEAGVEPAKIFLNSINAPQKLIKNVQALVKEHLRPFTLYIDRKKVSNAAIRRLALRVHIPQLILVAKADSQGRSTSKIKKEQALEALKWLEQRSSTLKVLQKGPHPYLLGRDLIAAGINPGPKIGEILEVAFEAQLDGVFLNRDDGLIWLTTYLKLSLES